MMISILGSNQMSLFQRYTMKCEINLHAYEKTILILNLSFSCKFHQYQIMDLVPKDLNKTCASLYFQIYISNKFQLIHVVSYMDLSDDKSNSVKTLWIHISKVLGHVFHQDDTVCCIKLFIPLESTHFNEWIHLITSPQSTIVQKDTSSILSRFKHSTLDYSSPWYHNTLLARVAIQTSLAPYRDSIGSSYDHVVISSTRWR